MHTTSSSTERRSTKKSSTNGDLRPGVGRRVNKANKAYSRAAAERCQKIFGMLDVLRGKFIRHVTPDGIHTPIDEEEHYDWHKSHEQLSKEALGYLLPLMSLAVDMEEMMTPVDDWVFTASESNDCTESKVACEVEGDGGGKGEGGGEIKHNVAHEDTACDV